MKLAQLKKLCCQFPAAGERLLPPPYNILVYSIGEQNFAYFKTSEPERWRFSIKVTPSQFVELTGLPGCKPARYRGRYHWITIVDVTHFPDDYLRELVAGSFRYAMAKLPRSRRPLEI
jgi:predicted DNA-binding protein (MmcQ/YjbR family)